MAAEVEVHDGTQVSARSRSSLWTQATERAERIRSHLADAAQDYAAAIIEQDWKVLGYGSVKAWREAMFAGTRLAVETRRQVVELLSAKGKTVRQIASATGVDHSTAVRDTQAASPAKTGAGGAKRTTTSPRQQAASRREERRRQQPAPAKVIPGTAEPPASDQPAPVAPPVTTTTETPAAPQAKTAATLREEVKAEVLGELTEKFETAFRDTEAERDQLAKENEKLTAKVAEQAGKLTHLPVLEKRLEELDKQSVRAGKLARVCGAHSAAIARCPQCGQ